MPARCRGEPYVRPRTNNERILDNSDFVVNVLNAANEQLEEKYALKAGGCSIDILIEVNGIERHKIIDVPISSVPISSQKKSKRPD